MGKLITILIFCCLIPLLSIEQDSSLVVKDSSNAIVIDDYGVSTGMTRAQLDKHKKDYVEKFKSIAAKRGISSEKLWEQSIEAYYNTKVDINRVEELKDLGIDLIAQASYIPSNDNTSTSLYLICAKMVAIGTIVSVKHPSSFLDYGKFYIEIGGVLKNIYNNNLTNIISVSYNSICTPSPVVGEKIICYLSLENSIYYGNFTQIDNANRFNMDGKKKKIDYLYKFMKQIKDINNPEIFYKQTWEISPPSLWEKIWYSIF